MKTILARASYRFLLQHPWQLALALLGVALGVAVVVSIDLAKTSALNAFDRATSAVVGKATHRIIGGPGGLNESLYVRLRVDQGIYPIKPVVEGYVKAQGTTLRLYGVDPFAELAFQTGWQRSLTSRSANGAAGITRLLTEPGTVLIGQATARRLQLKTGDALNILIGTQRRTAQVIGVLMPEDAVSRQSLHNLLIADIATAQELLGRVGRLDGIDLILAEDTKALPKIKAALPEGAELITTGAGSQSVRDMTRAFYTNLSALSMLSLLVGMFLIYNTMTFMVVQRRRLIGNLRVLGVTRRQVIQFMLMEAGIIGAVGSLAGIVLGIFLGHGMLDLLTRTLHNVYFVLPAARLDLSPLWLIKGGLLGFGATLLASAKPALEATRIAPIHALARSHLESRIHRLLWRSALIGLLAAGIGVSILWLSNKSLFLGFAGMLLIVLACALLTPGVTVLLTGFLRALFGRLFGLMGRLPARSVSASLSRTGVAIAALMIAIATVIGMELMAHSFRLSVLHWLQERMDADLYIYAPMADSAGSPSALNRALTRRIRQLPGVSAVGTVRRVRIKEASGMTQVNAYEMSPQSFAGFQWTQRAVEDVWQAFARQGWVIVSEPYAYHHNLQAGDTLRLRTDRGEHTFKIAAVYRDYNAGQGIVSMSRATYDRHWQDDAFSGIWVYVEPAAQLETLKQAIYGLSQPGQVFEVRSYRAIIEASMKIFDQAFVISEVLRWLAATVAFIGVFSALMALQLERTREFGTLRALGMTPRQLGALIFSETGLMGLIAGLLALPVGTLTGLMLIFVINRRSFGWGMELAVNPAIFGQGLLLAIVAALLAGLYPAWRMANTRPAEALRAE